MIFQRHLRAFHNRLRLLIRRFREQHYNSAGINHVLLFQIILPQHFRRHWSSCRIRPTHKRHRTVFLLRNYNRSRNPQMSCRLFQPVHDRFADPLRRKRLAVNLLHIFLVKLPQNPIQPMCDRLLILPGPDIFDNSIIIKRKSLICRYHAYFPILPMRRISKLSDRENLFPEITFHNHKFCFRRIMSVFHPRCFRCFFAFITEQRFIYADRSDYFLKHLSCHSTRAENHRRSHRHVKNR